MPQLLPRLVPVLMALNFPRLAGSASPSVLKALRAILPCETLVFPVGGITPEIMEGYWMAGAPVASGLGSNLYKAGKSVGAIKADADSFVRAINLLNRDLAKGPPE